MAGKTNRPKRKGADKNSSPNSSNPTTPKKQRFDGNGSSPATPTSSPSSRRKNNQPRLAPTKNDFNKPTWEDTARPIILHGEKIHDDLWMAGYLGYNTKFLVRNLAMSPLVLPWAVEQSVFVWKPSEVPAALTMLAESKNFGNGDEDLKLSAFGKASDVYQEYLLPHEEGGKVNPKLVSNEKRVEALARILITVSEELECLTGEIDHDSFLDHYKDHRTEVEKRIRVINDMDYFGLPDIPLDRLQAPELGPLEFNGRKEHVYEKWVRILTLLRYASSRVSKSKYVMSGCIGALLGDSDAQRKKLSPEARRNLIDTGGAKWLGLEEDWAGQTLDPNGIPIWMRPEAMDIDRTRKIQGNTSKEPERRAIKFEGLWLEDFPGDDPDLGLRCKASWADPALRDQFGIPAHVKHPDFAVRGKRPELRDPRDFPGYPQWRDSLRAGLFLTAWKLNFESAWLIDRKMTKTAIGPDLLAGEADESDVAHEPHCIKIFDASGADPPLDYADLLSLVEKGQATQTVAFLCEPLEGSNIRHYPWETTLYISGSNEELKFTNEEDFSTAVEKDGQKKTEAEEGPAQQQPSAEVEPQQPQPSTEEGPEQQQPSAEGEPQQPQPSTEGEPEQQQPSAEVEPQQPQPSTEGEPEQQQPSAEGEPPEGGQEQPRPEAEEDPVQQHAAVGEKSGRRPKASPIKALVEQALRALPISSASIKRAETLGKKISEYQDTSDIHLDIFDLGFVDEETQLEFFSQYDIRTKYGRLGWSDFMIKTVLADLRVPQRLTVWGNENWLLQTPNVEVTRQQIDEARNIADKERAVEADEEDNGIDPDSQKDHSGQDYEQDDSDEELASADVHSQSITQAAASMSVSSEACLGPPLQPCCAALGFVETDYKHGPNKLSTYKSPHFPTASGRHFLAHQVTGVTFLIYKLVGKIPKLSGSTKEQASAAEWLSRHLAQTWCAVVADNMGLGKTFETVSAIYFVMKYASHFVEEGEKYKPTLILSPSTEILRIWDKEIMEHYPKIKRIVAAHVNRESLAPGSKYVTRAQCIGLESWPKALQYVWDENDRNAEWTVILSTVETYASRTLRTDHEDNDVLYRSRWAEKGYEFRTLVIDEAQRIRNTDTKGYQATSITEYERSVLISATPSFMNHQDVVSLYNIAWGSYRAYMERCHPEKLAWCEKNVKSTKTLRKLDDMDPSDPRKAFAIKPKLVKALISNGQLPLLNRYMPLVEGCVMIRRSTQSFIPDGINGGLVSLRGLLPEVKALTASISHDPHGESYNQAVHYNLSMDYNEAVSAFMKAGGMDRAAIDSSIRPNLTENTRKFLMISSGTNLYRLDDIFRKANDKANVSGSTRKDGKMDLHTPTLTKMRRAGVDAFDLVEIVRVDSDPEWDSETSMNPKDALWILVRGCPVLQFILQQVRDKILTPLRTGRPIKKIEIVEEVPATAFYYERVLQFVGIKARVYHSALNPTEREKLKAEFRSDDPESVAVLILMYRVGSVGLNLDGGCSTVIIATPGDSHYKEEQAAYRVIRITTKHGVVEVIRVKVQNSYHEYKESRQIDRLIPDLASREFEPKNLAAMLNALQIEIDEAHESEAGKDLIEKQDLLVESASRDRLKDSLLQLKNSQDREADDPGAKPRDPSKEEILSSYKLISPSAKGFSGEFLEKMSRKDYYRQWRPLDAKTKSLFSHSKNRLRRLLSFPPGKTYTAVDLEVAARAGDEAVMERAFECLYKIKVGTRNVHHKPSPHIDFDMLPKGTDWAVFENMPDVDLDDFEDFESDDEGVERSGRVDDDDKTDSEAGEEDSVEFNLGE